ncbi:hypothetical protein AB1Y20_011520 [Prymnesium parvum]|uniref:Mesencephalic astrocyte-derived neurotrophic factor homolog n=1 Tax=Prymnesium parvum TaxID=97485 RepID=A0AB34IIG2_PRYPA
MRFSLEPHVTSPRPVMRLFLLVALAVATLAKKVDDSDCEVCKSVISSIDSMLTAADRKSPDAVEKVMQKYCNAAKLQDKKMCYYMGVGDAESGTAGGVKREISSSLTRGINAKRLCTRLKSKDAQMCELKYEKKIDPHTTNFAKLRVKELRKICDNEGIDTTGLVEKDEYIKKIKTHFNIKDEV